jgi:hypothetical protein
MILILVAGTVIHVYSNSTALKIDIATTHAAERTRELAADCPDDPGGADCSVLLHISSSIVAIGFGHLHSAGFEEPLNMTSVMDFASALSICIPQSSFSDGSSMITGHDDGGDAPSIGSPPSTMKEPTCLEHPFVLFRGFRATPLELEMVNSMDPLSMSPENVEKSSAALFGQGFGNPKYQLNSRVLLPGHSGRTKC